MHHTPMAMFISFGLKTKARTRCNSDTRTGPYPGLTKGGGELIGWGGGGGRARHRRSLDREGSGGMLLQNFVYKFD